MPDTTADFNETPIPKDDQPIISPDENGRSPNTAQASEGYREHSNAHEELQKAVDSVPLKDYCDYEITIETKQHYQDALFSDEDELYQALNQSSQEQPSTVENTNATQQPVSKDETSSVDIDYSAFLTASAVAGFTIQTQTAKAGDKINIINNRLNDSPARKNMPKGAKAKQFDKLVTKLAEKIAAEKKLAIEAAEAKLKVPTSVTRGDGKLARITQKLKTKSKELSLKGIAQFDKSRAELDEYLGLSLPERTIALDFILPTLKSKKEQDSIPSKQSIEKLFTVKGKTLASILNKSNSDLGKISKTQLSNSHRLELLDSYMPLLGEKIESLISMFERKPSVTDEGKRLLILDNALASIKHLTTGYKQVYASLYESANVIYGPQRKIANDTAIKVLVCLHLEKRLAIATHSSTNHSSAKTFNTVFHVLKNYEPQVLQQTLTTAINAGTKTVTDLFINFQLLQALDFRYISTGLHRLLHNYLKYHHALLELIDPEITDNMVSIDAGQQLWQCCSDSYAPAYFSSQQTINNSGNETCKPVYIKIQSLFNQIKNDYVASLKLRIHKKQKIYPASIGEININQALMLFSAMNRLIIHCENHTITSEYTIYQPTTISAYTSIEAITDYFKHLYSTQSKGPKTKNQNNNDTPKPPASKSQWLCATEDENFIYLQTAEDKLAITLDIGDLILLVRTADTENDREDQQKTQLEAEAKETIIGKVTHLDRCPQAKLSMAIQKFALAACVINFEESKKPGVLVQSVNNHRLILASDNHVASNQQLAFSFPDSYNGQLAINGLEHSCNGSDIFALI